MASIEAYTALKNFLVVEFAPREVFDIDQIESQLVAGQEPQQENAQFLVLEEISGTEELIAIGDPNNLCDRETGVIEVHCFTPAPESSADARVFGQAVQDSLRHRTTNGVRVTTASPPDIGRTNDGLWTVGTVAVGYEYQRYTAAQ